MNTLRTPLAQQVAQEPDAPTEQQRLTPPRHKQNAAFVYIASIVAIVVIVQFILAPIVAHFNPPTQKAATLPVPTHAPVATAAPVVVVVTPVPTPQPVCASVTEQINSIDQLLGTGRWELA